VLVGIGDAFSVFEPVDARSRLTLDLAAEPDAVADADIQVAKLLYELGRLLLTRVVCRT
jgi:hypothetical protein